MRRDIDELRELRNSFLFSRKELLKAGVISSDDWYVIYLELRDAINRIHNKRANNRPDFRMLIPHYKAFADRDDLPIRLSRVDDPFLIMFIPPASTVNEGE